MYTKEDLKIGRGLLVLFTRFVQHLIDEGLAERTIKNQGSHLAALGGEIIWNLNRLDEENRKLSPRNLSCNMSTIKEARCSLIGMPAIKIAGAV